MPASERKRLHFVDVLRLIALLQMVNGHTLHAVLSSEVRHGALYSGYLWFRGLVSVAFMLVAGFAFYLTTVTRQQAQAPSERRRRIVRALEIITIGAVLRLPISAIVAGDARAVSRGLSSLAQVDVLPCIGVSLLILEGVLALCRTRTAVVLASGALCLATTFAAGWGAALPSALPLGYLTGWLGPQGGSSFPLVPYAGYVFAGVVLGGCALPLAAATPAPRAAGRLALAAAASWLMSKVFELIPRSWLGAHGPLVHTPAFFMLKLSVVTLAAAVLAVATRRVSKLPPSLATLTAETLGVYVFHLFVLYGWPLALARRIGPTLDVPHALGVSLAMVLASFAFGLVWRWFKGLRSARDRWPVVRTASITGVIAWVAVLAFPLAAIGGERRDASQPRVLSVSVPVSDLASAERFFVESLGFRAQGGPRTLAGEAYSRVIGTTGVLARSQVLRVGRERIELVAFDPPGREIPSDSASDDLWFQHLALVTRDIDASHAKLSAARVRAISSAPQTLPITNPAAAGIRAFYFQGPALHPLELISYPKGKGEARWQVAGRAGSAAEVLGIDHTAIAVSNTDRSKHFYTELLGLRVAGTSLNSGAEQAALGGVPDPRVRITTLRGESGPGIELLEYESPRRGRLTPRDTRANDAWRCVITLAMTDLTHTVARLRAAGTPIVSGDIREAAGLFEGGTRAVEVLDPDGHALRLVQ